MTGTGIPLPLLQKLKSLVDSSTPGGQSNSDNRLRSSQSNKYKFPSGGFVSTYLDSDADDLY